MLTFNIVNIGGFFYRCVLGERYYFDFNIKQLELFKKDCFFDVLKLSEGNLVFDLSDRCVGDVVSVRFSKNEQHIWILARVGLSGEVFCKQV